MLNILVTGSNGQLGSELQALHENYREYNFTFTDRESLDITCKDCISLTCKEKNITHIINCAAYTAVDKAEEDQDNADAINHLAVQNLAEIAKEMGISLIHISTDYVFDGKNYKPYAENDDVNPQGIYGKTKLDGEEALLHVSPPKSIIIRTSWVYSSFGNNFVKTMLRLGKERDELGVIFDQVGTPTYAKDLAEVVLEIIEQISRLSRFARSDEDYEKEKNGHCEEQSDVAIYHYSNEGVLSWYDFAKEIMRMAKLTCKVSPIETTDYPTPAKRPHFSLLNKSKIKKEFNLSIPFWKDSLDECLKTMGERR